MDFSQVNFLTTMESTFDDGFFNDDDGIPSPAPIAQSANGTTPAPSSGAPRVRLLDQGGGASGGGTTGSGAGGGGQRVKQVLDIIVFHLPDQCKTKSWGSCDWSALGVGVNSADMPGGVSYCCSEIAVSKQVCTSDMMGRLMIDPKLFKGEQRSVEVPTEPNTEFTLDNPLIEVGVTGDYIALLANCDDFGMDVFSVGSIEWKSVKGYLPGDMFRLMTFYIVMAAVYLVLVLWYWCGMRMYQDAAIPIQKFILATIFLGLLEFLLRSTDLATWNLDGIRSQAVIWSGKPFLLIVCQWSERRCCG